MLKSICIQVFISYPFYQGSGIIAEKETKKLQEPKAVDGNCVVGHSRAAEQITAVRKVCARLAQTRQILVESKEVGIVLPLTKEP